MTECREEPMCGLMRRAISHSWHHHWLTEALTGMGHSGSFADGALLQKSSIKPSSTVIDDGDFQAERFQVASDSIAYFMVQSKRGLGKTLKFSTTRYSLLIQYILRDDAWRFRGCSSFIPSDLQSSIHIDSHFSDHRSRHPCLSLVILVHLISFYSIPLSIQAVQKACKGLASVLIGGLATSIAQNLKKGPIVPDRRKSHPTATLRWVVHR